MLYLLKNTLGTMKHSLKGNLQDIHKSYKKILIKSSIDNVQSIQDEFREWIDDSFMGNEPIWTLPDLTRSERLSNFCRAIKKKIN